MGSAASISLNISTSVSALTFISPLACLLQASLALPVVHDFRLLASTSNV
jgi:hypothetical protein